MCLIVAFRYLACFSNDDNAEGQYFSLTVQGYTEQLKFLKSVEAELEENLHLLEKFYILHKNLEVKLENLNQKKEDDRAMAPENLAYKPVFKAVRSLRLHLQTTLQRYLFSFFL